MQKNIIIIFLLLIGLNIKGQDLISVSGDYKQNSTGFIEYSIGEVVTESFSGDQYIITDGFHQSNIIITIVKEIDSINIAISPNPTSGIIKLKIEECNLLYTEYFLYDINGKTIERKKLNSCESEINLTKFRASTYYVKVIVKGKMVKIFKLVKQ